ncbi:uncharacterized protein SPAPADRAFT_72087 [Spathaspora passalidarum NRRL Y-27907]|uniref:diacylglycerol O-acyltransferase n=1 Tax=Spathaspora passalidarum (strain NRRL Y-27907 / 11-Y1) TaxID=619300 RepID=G3AR62_SPAPN|nr:uncharacterized protein SPAPADRAFT_72087 [Spathaspora passalidarum NRRL Y-27907]EGW31235.1 hypothetical protein SPAPADRAFT_72087 [Spathaspora passalidarum NRRL Y-27907]
MNEETSTLLRNRKGEDHDSNKPQTVEIANPDIDSSSVQDTPMTHRSLESRDSTISSGDSNASVKSKPLLHIAPLNTPLQHRLETLGIMWHCLSIPFFICLFLLTISVGWVVWLCILAPYFVWWYGFDLHTPTNGKAAYRVRYWMKNLIIWDWFVNYFPIRVHKTVDLEPTFTYVEENVEKENLAKDDEQDLVSENSRTVIDKIFKFLGLKKRLNDDEQNGTISPTTTTTNGKKRVHKVTTGPRYIFGYHPHGVISMGVVGSFVTNVLRNEPWSPPLKFLKPLFHDSSKGERLLPGIGNIFPLTLTTQFTIPFYRDYLLSMGLTSASAKNIKSLINNGDNSVCLVVGGAQESLLNHMVAGNTRVGYGFKKDLSDSEKDQAKEELPAEVKQEKTEQINGVKLEDNSQVKKESQEEVDEVKQEQPQLEVPKREVKLILNKRKGFVKVAIELGNICLVPTFAFGEADIYHLTVPEPGSLGYKFQQLVKDVFQFTIPFFSARGVFIYDFGFLPYRTPINICMGRPIYIPSTALQDYLKEHPEEEEKEISTDHKKPSHPKQTPILGKLFPKPGAPIRTKIPQKLLDHYHKLYVEELKRVFEDNKERFGYGDVQLNIVE